MKSVRSDRITGNRGAYENARKKILATQTICGICGKPVDFSYRTPHPLSPTIDHIIPVSKGGHPSDISNLQLAHRCCNREKSDKLFMDARRAAKSGGKSAKKGGNFEPSTPVPNQLLEQHADWMTYRAASGS